MNEKKAEGLERESRESVCACESVYVCVSASVRRELKREKIICAFPFRGSSCSNRCRGRGSSGFFTCHDEILVPDSSQLEEHWHGIHHLAQLNYHPALWLCHAVRQPGFSGYIIDSKHRGRARRTVGLFSPTHKHCSARRLHTSVFAVFVVSNLERVSSELEKNDWNHLFFLPLTLSLQDTNWFKSPKHMLTK